MRDPRKDPYPVTIIRTRYGGTYEGGAWAAFNLDEHEVPEDHAGSDPECWNWWDRWGAGVGVGATPGEALAALSAIDRPLRSLYDESLSTRVVDFADWDQWRRAVSAGTAGEETAE